MRVYPTDKVNWKRLFAIVDNFEISGRSVMKDIQIHAFPGTISQSTTIYLGQLLISERDPQTTPQPPSTIECSREQVLPHSKSKYLLSARMICFLSRS